MVVWWVFLDCLGIVSLNILVGMVLVGLIGIFDCSC